MTTSTRVSIDTFLAQHRLAVVGVSRNPHDFSRMLFDELRSRGYDVVPVNPNADEIAGLPCVASVSAISPPVDGVLIMTPPAATEQVVRDCAAAGIDKVWMHRGEGIGAVSDAALAFCAENGIDAVPGHCPYMFLPDSGFIHKAHAWIMKLNGSYPT